MRLLAYTALVISAILVPAIAGRAAYNPLPVSLHAPATAPARLYNPATAYSDRLLLVSATGGLHILIAHGRGWIAHQPQGHLPARGSFLALVADPDHPGTAYLSNGDVFVTTDGGDHWQALPRPRAPLGPAGITALAIDPQDGTLYAASADVLAYRRHTWSAWGRHWPSSARPTVLLAVPGHGVYAAAGDRLIYAAASTSTWQPLDTHAWRGAPLTALGLGPDGTTPYVAPLGHGLWYLDSIGAHRITGLPSSMRIYGLQSNIPHADLYALTDQGLFVRHRPADSDSPWLPAIQNMASPIIALAFGQQGTTMTALSQDGSLVSGRLEQGILAARGQHREQLPIHDSPLITALSGPAWQKPALPPALPSLFARPCLPNVGTARGQGFDICGPFALFYERYGANAVLGYPLGPATRLGQSGVTQNFEKAQLIWDSHLNTVRLARLGIRLARLRHPARFHFPRPSPQEAVKAHTTYVNGYYVDRLFYQFWLAYQDRTGASIFGPPISQLVREKSTDGSGRIVPMQYFTNAVLEYHSEYPPGSQIQLSYVGGR